MGVRSGYSRWADSVRPRRHRVWLPFLLALVAAGLAAAAALGFGRPW